MNYQNRIITKEQIFDKIWGFNSETTTNVVEVYASGIRKELKKYDYDKDEEINREIKKLEEEFSGNGRVLIRTSGTEPIVRVMIEGENQEYITEKAKEIANLIESKLGK